CQSPSNSSFRHPAASRPWPRARQASAASNAARYFDRPPGTEPCGNYRFLLRSANQDDGRHPAQRSPPATPRLGPQPPIWLARGPWDSAAWSPPNAGSVDRRTTVSTYAPKDGWPHGLRQPSQRSSQGLPAVAAATTAYQT